MEFDGLINQYNIPRICVKCNGIMIFKGVGEYQCEDCGEIEYDDYGKVRNYIEQHRGANAAEVEAGTGVTQKSIRKMLRESRIQIAEGSQVFLRCDLCGKSIRSGVYCPECEIKVHRNIEEHQRSMMHDDARAYGMSRTGEDGQMRFVQR